MQKSLPVEAIVDRLGHKERTLKNAGAFAEAAGLRDAVVIVLRMADEGDSERAAPDESSE